VPGRDVEPGLGEAGQPAAAGVVDGGAVFLELAGELADRGGGRFQDAVLAEPGGEGGEAAGVEGVQADEVLGGGAVHRAGHRDGEHHREPGPVGEEAEAFGGHEAQRPAGPYQGRQGGGQAAGLAGAGHAGRAGDGTVAELVKRVEPGCERPGQCGSQGGAGPAPGGEDIGRA
jgi:hypothetical protein